MRRIRLRAKSIALVTTGLSVLLGSGSAFAQANQGSNEPVETVTVTGTRIPTPEAESAIPIQSVTAQDIAYSGTLNLTDYLKHIPALAGSTGDLQQSGLNTTDSPAGVSLSGMNFLDLRNLGFTRTLVLEDGQRVISSTAGTSAVDINTIPITLIDRVDVLTGGASAIYGADGVSGVVNFVMKHDLEGIDARAQVSAPQDGGDNKYLAAASIGHNFDNDHGNVEVTLEESYENRLNYTQRSFTKTGGAIWFVPNPANPDGTDPTSPASVAVKNGVIFQGSANGAIDTDVADIIAGNSYQPNFNGDGTPFRLGVEPTGSSGEFAIGGDGAPISPSLLADLSPIEHRTIAQATADEEFSRWFKLSGEFRFVHVDTKSQSEPSFNEFASITSDNPFLPADVRTAIEGNGTAGLVGPYSVGTLSSYPYLTPGLVLAERDTRDTYRGVVGVDGDLPLPPFFHDAKYDIHYVYGQSDVDDTIENNLAEDRYYAALDSVSSPNGPVCRSNIDSAAVPPTTVFGDGLFDELVGLPSSLFGTQYNTFMPGPNSGCVAYNPFVTNSAQDIKATAWMTMNTPTFSLLHEQDLNGYVNFDFPQFVDWGLTAKPVAFAFGGEWRQEYSKSSSDPITRPVPVPYEPGTTESLFFSGGVEPLKGQFEVSEAFGEMSVPLLANRPLAEELTFEFAGRISDYSTAGTDETWRLSGEYVPIAGIKFRATDAVAVRAPNIGELFAPTVEGFEPIDDPCDVEYINQGTQYRKGNCQTLENALLGPGAYTAGVTPVQASSTLPVYTGGNPNLAPETARTLTLGTVIQPDFMPGFMVTVDWYHVNITSAIASLPAQVIADQCVDLSTLSNPFCAAITRFGNGSPIPGSIKQVVANEINVASYFTQGVDFTASYAADMDDWFDSHVGTLNLSLTGNHMDILQLTSMAGQIPVNDANVINGGIEDNGPAPFWQVYLEAVWNRDDWTVDYNIQWSDGLLNLTRLQLDTEPNFLPAKYIHTPDQDIHSIQVRYQLNDSWQAYVGINNLWYQKPSANDYLNGYPADPTGRMFYVGVQVDMDPME